MTITEAMFCRFLIQILCLGQPVPPQGGRNPEVVDRAGDVPERLAVLQKLVVLVVDLESLWLLDGEDFSFEMSHEADQS